MVMLVNLQRRFRFNHFRMVATPDLSIDGVRDSLQSARAAFGESEYMPPGWAARFYRRAGVTHLATVSIPEDDDSSDIIFTYSPLRDTDSGSLPVGERQRFNQASAAIAELALPCTILAHATCSLDTAEWTPYLRLPLLALNAPDRAFDEIRGVRMVRTEGERVVESTTLDVLEAGVLTVTIRMTRDTQLIAKTPGDLLEQLGHLFAKFVFRSQKEE